MKVTVLYIGLFVVFADLINAKSITMNVPRERRAAAKPKPKPKAAAKPNPQPGPGPAQGPAISPGPLPGPAPGQMVPPMPGPIPAMSGPMPMGGPACGGCAQSQEPKQCPAICMRWNTIIKPNGQVENGPSSITPLSPSERVGPNGIFPPMNSFMQQPMMPQPMMPQPMMPFAMPGPVMPAPAASSPGTSPGAPAPGTSTPGAPSAGAQPPAGSPPAQGSAPSTPNAGGGHF